MPDPAPLLPPTPSRQVVGGRFEELQEQVKGYVTKLAAVEGEVGGAHASCPCCVCAPPSCVLRSSAMSIVCTHLMCAGAPHAHQVGRLRAELSRSTDACSRLDAERADLRRGLDTAREEVQGLRLSLAEAEQAGQAASTAARTMEVRWACWPRGQSALRHEDVIGLLLYS